MLLAIYIALLIFTVLVLLVLFAAIDIFVEFEKKGSYMQHMVHIKWLFFRKVVNSKSSNEFDMDEDDMNAISELESTFKSTSDAESESEPKPDSDAKEKSSKFKWGIRDSIAALKLLVKPVLKLLDGILSTIHIRSFKCDMRFGFDDPANTGIICGYIYALRGYLLHKCKKVELDVEPIFVDETMDLFAVANFRIRLASLIPTILLFVLNRSVLRVSWAYLRNKGIQA